jgi:hypothetical protein
VGTPCLRRLRPPTVDLIDFLYLPHKNTALQSFTNNAKLISIKRLSRIANSYHEWEKRI